MTMSANESYWAGARTMTPGEQLAALQAAQYKSETIERLMLKFDERILHLTAGIQDPAELAAAQGKAEALLAEKQAVACGRATMTATELRAAVVKLAVKAGVTPDQAPVRKSRGLMARRWITPIMLTLILMQSVTPGADARTVRHPGDKPGIFSESILSN